MKTSLMVAFAVSGLSFSGHAAAQTPPALADQLRLSLGTSLFSYTSGEIEFEGGAEVDTSTTKWGLPAESTDIQVAYGVTETIAVGGSFTLTHEGSEQDQGGAESESSETTFSLGPIVDFTFSRTDNFCPFVSAGVAFAVSSEESGGVEASLTGFSLTGAVGLRYFIVPELSLDPVFGLTWATLSGEREGGGAETDVDASGVTLRLGAYLSLWL